MLYHVGTHIDFTKPAPKTRLDVSGLYEPGTQFRFVKILSDAGILPISKSLNLIIVQ